MTTQEPTHLPVQDEKDTPRKSRRWWIIVIPVLIVALLAGGAFIGMPLLEKQTIEKAEAALQAEQPDEAIAAIESVLKYRQSGLLKQIPQLLTLRGRAYFAQNDFDRALADFEEALQLDPQQTEIHQYRTQIYLAQGNLQQAAEEALLADPQSGLSESLKAFLAYEANDYKTAAAMAETALTKTKPLAEAYLVLGALQTWREEYRDGLTNLNRALELDPQNVQALAYRAFLYSSLRDWKSAEEDAQSLNSLAPNSPFNFWVQGIMLDKNYETEQGLEQANRAIAEEERPEFFYSRAKIEQELNPPACWTDIDKALSINPDFFPAIALQKLFAFDEWELKDVDGAIQALRAISPNSISATYLEIKQANRLYFHDRSAELYQRLSAEYPDLINECTWGYWYLQQNYPDKAQELVNSRLEKEPQSVCAMALGGDIALWRLDKKTAHQYADQILALHPTNLEALQLKTYAYLAVAPTATDIEEARKLIDQFRQIAPESHHLYWMEHYLAGAEEDDAQILSTATVLVQRQPGNPYALLRRAEGYLFNDNESRFMDDIEAALALQERLPEAYQKRARQYVVDGKLDLATADCQRALEINPRQSEAYTHLARIALLNKEYQTSIEQAKKALEIDPYDLNSYKALSEAQFKSGQLDEFLKTMAIILDHEEELSPQELTLIEQAYNAIKQLPPLVNGKRTQNIGNYQVSIDYPANWLPMEYKDVDLTLYPYQDDADVWVYFHVMDNPFPGAVTPQILVNAWAKMHEQEGLKMERLEKGSLRNSKETCETYTSHHETYKDGKKVFVYSRAYMFVSNDIMIMAEVTAPDKDTLDRYLTEVDDIMRSLTFLSK